MARLAVLMMCLCFATLNAQDNGKGKGKGKGRPENAGGSDAVTVNVTFGSDANVIRDYYRTNPSVLPPGLAKNLARGKALPPGWQKKLQPFPADLTARLGPSCATCGRGVYGGYGVIYDKKTAIILDVIRLAGDVLR